MGWDVKTVPIQNQYLKEIQVLNQLSMIFVDNSEKIDWKEELRKVKPRWKKLIKKSEDFCTCMVGHQSSVIPRTLGGVPSYKELEKLGYEFMNACSKEDKEQVRMLFKKITKISISKSKICITKIKKLFKKDIDKYQEYANGRRTFHVSIDKEGNIVNFKEDSKFIVKLSDEYINNETTNESN